MTHWMNANLIQLQFDQYVPHRYPVYPVAHCTEPLTVPRQLESGIQLNAIFGLNVLCQYPLDKRGSESPSTLQSNPDNGIHFEQNDDP